MRTAARIIAALGVAAALVAAMACGDGQADSDDLKTVTGLVQAQAEAMASGAAQQSSGAASGIWVTGQASVSVEPDLVLLTVGVETTARTVAEARAEAAGAMDAIVRSVMANGLREQDVQTQSFNIWPQYEYPEVLEGDVLTRRQVLVGYTVSNSARIRIRDVDSVGTIIDDVAEAGGDATRINGIDFSIDDPASFMTGLREEAVQDAIAKAEHLASLAGVALGDLIFVGEIGAGPSPMAGFVQEAAMARAFNQASPISGGELSLSLTVQAAFSIR